MHSKLRCRIGKERIHHNVKQFLLQKLIKATSCSRSNINFFEEQYYLPGLYETHMTRDMVMVGYMEIIILCINLLNDLMSASLSWVKAPDHTPPGGFLKMKIK